MVRNLNKLANETFDLLVIGGGIQGAAIFWEACQAGLSAALIEKGDFAQATSANTQKIIHGGLRYLQQLDLPRVRQSLHERQRLMYLAPHLVRPLPCVMPLYGYGLKGKEAAWLGLRLYDLVGLRRDDLSGASRDVPRGKILTKSDICHLIPDLGQKHLRGGVQWCDAICSNTERLVLAFIKSGCKLGGTAANYLTATDLVKRNDSILIVSSRDKLSDDKIDILAKKVINSTGPWVNDFLNTSKIKPSNNNQAFAIGINIVTKPIFPTNVAVAVRSRADSNARVYFVVPWRQRAIIGTAWWNYNGDVNDLKVTRNHCQKLLDGFNSAYPTGKLKLEDILHIHSGLVPSHKSSAFSHNDVSLVKCYQIMDHSKEGMNGLFSVMGVKYTTAVDVAKKVLRQVMPGTKSKPLLSQPRLIGGEIDDFKKYQGKVLNEYGQEIEKDTLINLTLNYGSELIKVIDLAHGPVSEGSAKRSLLPDIIKGETLFAVRHEMAQKLTDVVLRRTGRGTAGFPSQSDLETISQCMKKELCWTESRRLAEIGEVKDSYPDFLPFTSS